MSDAVPGRLRAPTAVSSIQGAWLVGLLAALLVLLWLTGDAGRELLRYERTAVLHGEYWRLLTGHLVHGSGQHLLLNAVGCRLPPCFRANTPCAAGCRSRQQYRDDRSRICVLEPQLSGTSASLASCTARRRRRHRLVAHESRPLALALTAVRRQLA
jgi:hypothetical protein